MNRFAGLVVLALLLLPFTAHADDASRRAKAEELTQLLHMDRSVNLLMEGLLQQTHNYMAQRYGNNPPPEAVAALSDLDKKITDLAAPQVGWDAVKPEYIRILSEKFTEPQLDSILAFYKSPSGKALLDTMPEVSQEASKIVETRFTTLQPQLRQLFQQFTQKLPPPTPGAARPAAPAPTPAPGTTK